MYDNRKHLNGSVMATDTNRMKLAAEWFYEKVFSDEAITPKKEPPRERLPSLLRTARSLEGGPQGGWQSREAIFLKQAKLLAAYEDDYCFSGSVQRYYPTYQSLTDQELRGYFSWRTKLRGGDIRKAPLTFAFLYIYELLNQIGVDNPLDGYQKLTHFRVVYGGLDGAVLPYLKRWMADYVIYYGLDPALLADAPQVKLDRSMAVLENMQGESPQAILEALEQLPLKWLGRSKFYQQNRQEMDTVIVRVLRRVGDHCDTRCKKGFVEQYIGGIQKDYVWLFEAAVFCDPLKRRSYEYALDEHCVFRCQNGHWMVEKYFLLPQHCAKLNDLLKTIDCLMREAFAYKHPIKCETETKWILRIIQEEVQALLAEKQAAQAKKITIDRRQLEKIRRDAAITQEKLTVEEELEEEAPEPPAPPEPPAAVEAPPDTPLNPTEYRLLQCLLYGMDRSWVRTEGYILSVLLDSINEKLYDVFQDSVLDDAGQPMEDYIDELKEMVTP